MSFEMGVFVARLLSLIVREEWFMQSREGAYKTPGSYEDGVP